MYPAGISDILCSGLERNILECNHRKTTTNACTPDKFSTIACRGKASPEASCIHVPLPICQ